MYYFASGKTATQFSFPKESLFGTPHLHDADTKNLFHFIGSRSRPTIRDGACERQISPQITYALIRRWHLRAGFCRRRYRPQTARPAHRAGHGPRATPVSYTHLTLPTILRV